MSTDDVGVSMNGHVATVELRRPPNNFLDTELIASLASALEALDGEIIPDLVREEVEALTGARMPREERLSDRDWDFIRTQREAVD